MENTLKQYGPLASRILLSAIFLLSGFSKIFDFTNQAAYVGSVLPAPALMLIVAIVLEVGGAIFLLVGYKTRLGVTLLIIFTILATAFFHTNFADQIQMIMFMKNLAIIGGLLSIAIYGAGPISVDSKNEAGLEN